MPNDPHRRQREEHADRPCNPMPLVLASLALWLLLLVALPVWLTGALVVTLLAGCVVSALLPLLSESGARRPGVRIVGFTNGSS